MPTRPPSHNRRDRPQPAVAVPVRVKLHESRASASKRGYGRKWQAARAGFLARHPLCVHCLAEDHVTAATVVDHIQPHRGDQALFWDVENNWQSLCKPHHDRKTVMEDGGMGNARKVRSNAEPQEKHPSDRPHFGGA